MLLTDFRIRNFKTFKDLELKNLKKVNIFVGEPNTGKTSILEALSLFLAKNPQILISVLDERSMVGDDTCFESLFFDYKTDEAIILESGSESLSISPNVQNKRVIFSEQTNIDNPNFPHTINDLAFSFGQGKPYSNISFNKIGNNQTEYNASIIRDKNNGLMEPLDKVEFIASLKNREYFRKLLKDLSAILTDTQKAKELQRNIGKFTVNIEDLRFVAGNKILIQQKNLRHAIDFRLLGQGFQSYIFILVAILSGKKYILIDELENGLHFSSIDLILESILKSPKDTQFFITTHNEELLERLAFKLEKNDKKIGEAVVAFKIYHDKEQKLKAVQYTQENFIHAMNYENEVRG